MGISIITVIAILSIIAVAVTHKVQSNKYVERIRELRDELTEAELDKRWAERRRRDTQFEIEIYEEVLEGMNNPTRALVRYNDDNYEYINSAIEITQDSFRYDVKDARGKVVFTAPITYIKSIKLLGDDE